MKAQTEPDAKISKTISNCFARAAGKQIKSRFIDGRIDKIAFHRTREKRQTSASHLTAQSKIWSLSAAKLPAARKSTATKPKRQRAFSCGVLPSTTEGKISEMTLEEEE